MSITWILAFTTAFISHSIHCLQEDEQYSSTTYPRCPRVPNSIVGYFSAGSFISRVLDHALGTDYPFEPIATNYVPEHDEENESPHRMNTDEQADSHSSRSGDISNDPQNFEPWDEEKFKKLFHDAIHKSHPLFGTAYAAEWGRINLTDTEEIPSDSNLIHFDVFAGFLPDGLELHDLHSLFLYTPKYDYDLYKIKLGDLVVTIRPTLSGKALQLFETFGKLITCRIFFVVDGLSQMHEYTETAKGSRTFIKTHGESVTISPSRVPPSEEIDEAFIQNWIKERCEKISKLKPPIAEEVVKAEISVR